MAFPPSLMPGYLTAPWDWAFPHEHGHENIERSLIVCYSLLNKTFLVNLFRFEGLFLLIILSV